MQRLLTVGCDGALPVAQASDLKALSGALVERKLATGTAIISQGEIGDDFYIIKSGSVSVSTQEQGEVATLSDGAFFGEMALLSDEPRAATITALTTVLCLVLERATFTKLLGPLRALLDATAEKRADAITKKSTARWYVSLVDAAYLRRPGQASAMGSAYSETVREVRGRYIRYGWAFVMGHTRHTRHTRYTRYTRYTRHKRYIRCR